MRSSLLASTPRLSSQQSLLSDVGVVAEDPVEVVGVVAAEALEAEEVEDKVKIKIVRTRITKVRTKGRIIGIRVKDKVSTLAMGHNVMLTHLHSSPAGAIGLTVGLLIFVKNHPHVHGKMSGFQSLIPNETGTSSG